MLPTDERELFELADLLKELEKRQQHSFIKYEPLPTQLKFHKSTAWCRLLFGGNRSGKSKSNSQEILWTATGTHPYQKTPKNPRIWVIAPEYRIIYEGIWGHLRNTLPAWEIEKFGSKVANWDIPSYIKFKSGAQIDFISAEGGDNDRKKLQAAEIDLVAIDEEVGGDLIDEIIARLVTKGGRIVVSATLINSEDWLLDWEQLADDPNEKDYEVFRLKTMDNPHNDQKVLQIFIKRLSPEDQAVRLEGRSRGIKGVYYPTQQTHWIKRFDIPPSWPCIHIHDSGFRVAASIWVRVTPERRFIVAEEMYLQYAQMRDWVEFWKLKEGWRFLNGVWLETDYTYKPLLRIIDPSDFNSQKDGSLGPAEQLDIHYGYQFIKGINNKDANIEDVRRLMQPPANPKLVFFNDLVYLRGEILKYRPYQKKTNRNSDDVKDRPLKKHDHIMNTLEYFASAAWQYDSFIPTDEEKAFISENDIDMPTNPEDYRRMMWHYAKLRQNRRQKRNY